MSKVFGICCECQSEQEVRVERDGTYLMASHMFQRTNMICCGSGTVPQSVHAQDGKRIDTNIEQDFMD